MESVYGYCLTDNVKMHGTASASGFTMLAYDGHRAYATTARLPTYSYIQYMHFKLLRVSWALVSHMHVSKELSSRSLQTATPAAFGLAAHARSRGLAYIYNEQC
jgi:hypothetical protein